jgi:hypothetical protein
MALTGVTIVPDVTLTLTCDADLSAKDGYAVVLDTTDELNVNLAAAATAFPFALKSGANGATAKALVTVVLSGGAKVKCGATVAPGDPLTATSDGRWIPATEGDHYGAVALEIGAANDLIAVSAERGIFTAGY